MAGNYSRRDPLAEALNAARGSYSASVEGAERRKRQEQLDAERAEDRKLNRGQLERTNEIQDVNLARSGVRRGQAPVDQVEIGEDDTLVAAMRQARQGGRAAAMPELEVPPALRTGGFKPGVGFDLPDLTAPAAPKLSAVETPTRSVARDPERYDQVSDNYYVDREQTPEVIARAEQERERTELEDALAELGHIGRPGAAAIARGAPAGLAVPDPYGGYRDREAAGADEEFFGDIRGRVAARHAPPRAYQPTTRQEWLDDQTALAGLRGTGENGVDPTTNAVTMRTKVLGAAGALARMDPPRTARQQEQYQQQVDRVLRYYGFESEEQLSELAGQLGVTDDEVADPVQAAIADLEKNGITDDDAIIAELVKLGLVAPGGEP